jgi:ribose transport system permease protein
MKAENFFKNDHPTNLRRFDLASLVKNNGLILAIIILLVIMAFTAPVFFNVNNIVNVFSRSAVTGVMAIGMCLVLLTGGLDMSVAAVASMSGLLSVGLFQNMGMPSGVAILIAIGFGVLIGFINGAMVSFLKINSLIATIATMTVVTGIGWVYSGGKNISPAPEALSVLTTTEVFGFIPLIIFVWVGIGVLFALFLKWTKMGRNFYAIGGNPEASRLSGIKVRMVRMWAYILCAVCASVAGMLLVSRLDSAIPGATSGMELTVIAAVVIGGTSLSGGVGKISGTFLGVLLISLIGNAITLWGVPTAYDSVFSGSVIGIAALMDSFRQSNK